MSTGDVPLAREAANEPVEASPAPPPAGGLLAALARISFAIGGTALVALVAVEAWQVVARYVLNDSPGWTEPAAMLLLTTAMSLGAAGAVHQGAHFGFFILREHSPPAIRRALELLAEAVITGLGSVIAIWGTVLFFDGLRVPMAGTWLPQSSAFLPMCVGGALMVLFALARLFALLRSPLARGDA